MFIRKLPKNNGPVNTGPIAEFLVRMTVMLGAGPSDAAGIRAALKSARCGVGDEADKMLDQIAVERETVEVDLVTPTVGELGYKHGADLKDIVAKALQSGLLLCAPEVAPQMCLQCKKLLRNEHLRIAMPVVVVSPLWLGTVSEGKRPLIYSVLRIQGKVWLGADPGMETSHYGATCRFVFIKPRKNE